MNKDEIKKGLEVCIMNVFRIACKKCPYNETNKCNDTLCKDAINLINEQKEEIERLKAVLEIEKKQAVKEFAEKIKDYFENKVVDTFGDMAVDVKYLTINIDEFEEYIDELLKEYEK